MEVTSIPSPSDYDEPKTAFLLLVKNLAYEGYSFQGVRKGMREAIFELGSRNVGDDWRGLFEALGDTSTLIDDDTDVDLKGDWDYGC